MIGKPLTSGVPPKKDRGLIQDGGGRSGDLDWKTADQEGKRIAGSKRKETHVVYSCHVFLITCYLSQSPQQCSSGRITQPASIQR